MTYTAELIGAPDVELDASEARIRLDAGQSPHVTGSLRISPAATIDPRTTQRVRVTEGARVFNLGIRSRRVGIDGLPTLELASDEALLLDYAPLADDGAPFALASSLRAVINYVLGTVIPGAALAATPALDADVTPFWDMTNLVPNPSVVNALGTYYVAGSNATNLQYDTGYGKFGTTCVRWDATAAGWSSLSARAYTASAGNVYTASAYVRQINGRNTRIRFNFRDSENELISTVAGATVAAASNWDARPHLTAVAPRGTARIGLLLEFEAGAAGQAARADAFMLHEGDRLVEYFDGSTTPAGYASSWSDAAHKSQSTRTPTPVERAPEALIWQAGVTALDFLLPLVQSAGYRLVCDETRTWTLRDENYVAPGEVQLRYGINMVDGDDTISRDDDSWFDAAIRRYRWLNRRGEQQERDDTYALTTPHTRLDLREIDAPYPGPGRAAYAVRRAQGRGRMVTATARAEWDVHAESPASIRHVDGVEQVGVVQLLEYDLDRDEMTTTVVSREVDAHAWIIQPTAAWTAGPVGEAWTEAA